MNTIIKMINDNIKTTTDTLLIETKEILDEKFLQSKNDINITSHILQYLTSYCDVCDELTLYHDLSDESFLDCEDEDCMELCCGHNNVEMCLECCMEYENCISCNDYFCNHNKSKHECDNVYCNNTNHRIFCDDCKYEQMYWCKECGEWKCCAVHYLINDELECDECFSSPERILPNYER